MTFVSRLGRQTIAQCVEQAPALGNPRAELRNFRVSGGGLSQTACAQLRATKASAVAAGDQVLAAAVWVLETVGKAQAKFAEAVQLCRQDRYYDAWVAFEQAEIQLCHLGYHFDDPVNQFGVAFILEHIPRFQSLFPYTLFGSPGFIKKTVLCSICNHKVTPRRPCGHRKFELYDGEMCGHRITESVLLEISVVKNPVQKYSVGFTSTPYNYGPVYYVVSGLRSAWTGWQVQTETHRITESMYAGCKRNDTCPCGSGKKFKKCCSGSGQTYEVPHSVVTIYEAPPPGWSRKDPMVTRFSVNDPPTKVPAKLPEDDG